ENGPQLTPCKPVITYKNQPAKPQFSAVFSDWDFAPRIAEPVFTPELPPGTQKIPFATVAGSGPFGNNWAMPSCRHAGLKSNAGRTAPSRVAGPSLSPRAGKGLG